MWAVYLFALLFFPAESSESQTIQLCITRKCEDTSKDCQAYETCALVPDEFSDSLREYFLAPGGDDDTLMRFDAGEPLTSDRDGSVTLTAEQAPKQDTTITDPPITTEPPTTIATTRGYPPHRRPARHNPWNCPPPPGPRRRPPPWCVSEWCLRTYNDLFSSEENRLPWWCEFYPPLEPLYG